MTGPDGKSDAEPVVTVRVATKDRWPDLDALWKDTDGCDGCWCFNHHIERGADDVRGGETREAKRRYLAAGRAHGVIAYLDGVPAGWCAADGARDLPGHDCVPKIRDAHDEGVWFIHCFFVKPSARGHGVARALLRGMLEWLRSAGARRVEGFPIPPGEKPPFPAFGGPFDLYLQEGFVRRDDVLGEGYCRVVLEPLSSSGSTNARS
jgi:GNAT superfamily N-acetyltransferase